MKKFRKVSLLVALVVTLFSNCHLGAVKMTYPQRNAILDLAEEMGQTELRHDIFMIFERMDSVENDYNPADIYPFPSRELVNSVFKTYFKDMQSIRSFNLEAKYLLGDDYDFCYAHLFKMFEDDMVKTYNYILKFY